MAGEQMVSVESRQRDSIVSRVDDLYASVEFALRARRARALVLNVGAVAVYDKLLGRNA